MNSEQRQKIRGLVQKYSDSGTESLIAFVADTDGTLAACQALMRSLEALDATSTEWLQKECAKENVPFHDVLQEVNKIVALFEPSRSVEDHHATLEISADADLDEIKQAYRILSRRYHPDTASPPYRDNPGKFIAINKAYHSLMSVAGNGPKDLYFQQEKQWRRKKERSVSPEQRKKVFIGALGLLLVLVVISAIASMNYRKRAMLAGLQESRGAFIPPAKKISDVSTGKADKVENKTIEQPSSSVALAKIPSQGVVPKVLPETAVDLPDIPMQELQKPSGHEIAVQSSPGKEQLPAKEPNKARQNRSKEKTEVVLTVAIEQPSQSTTNPKRQVARKEQASNPETDLIFSSKVPAPAVIIIGDKKAEDAQSTYASVTEAKAMPAADPPFQEDNSKQEKSDMQIRVDRFLANYVKAYEQRNLILYSMFFQADADENGKLFTAVLPTYLELFAATNRISMGIEQSSLRLVDGTVVFGGRFKVNLQYNDGKAINGSGPIDFVLVDNGGELLIKKMQYIFHTE